MIAVDTNVVVRFLTRDDEQQYEKSLKLFQEQDIFIPDTVILETEWVLRSRYKFEPDKICKAFTNLLGLPNVHIVDTDLLAQVLQWHENGLDFADAFHLAQSQNCSVMYTFDDKFVRRAEGLTHCDVVQPE